MSVDANGVLSYWKWKVAVERLGQHACFGVHETVRDWLSRVST